MSRVRDSRPPLADSVLTHSDNTVYAVRYAHPNCAFGTTSHTPKPLGEMLGRVLQEEKT